jgi:hypothetical protein
VLLKSNRIVAERVEDNPGTTTPEAFRTHFAGHGFVLGKIGNNKGDGESVVELSLKFSIHRGFLVDSGCFPGCRTFYYATP